MSGSSSRSVSGPTGAGSWRGRSSSCCTGPGVGGTWGVDGACGVTGAVWDGGAGLPFDGVVGVVVGVGVPAGVRVPGLCGVGVLQAADRGVRTRRWRARAVPGLPADPPPGPGAAAGVGPASAATGAAAAEVSPEPPEAGTDCSTAGSEGRRPPGPAS